MTQAVNGSRVLLNILMEQAGYTDTSDVLFVMTDPFDPACIIAIVPDHQEDTYIVSSWLVAQNDWIAEPHYEGPLDGCLDYLRETGIT